MQNQITFLAGDGKTELQGIWHPPTSQATNGAVIVLHGRAYSKDLQPTTGLCEGAAALGLTALRFDFRYVSTGKSEDFDPTTDGLDDLIGAYNFLQSFGKEIKPKRIYLIGKSLGGLVALKMATHPTYAASVSGVGVLGLVLFSDETHQNRFVPEGLPALQSPLLVVQGEDDPYGNEKELKEFIAGLNVPGQLAIIPASGHSYQTLDPALDETEKRTISDLNLEKVVKLSLDWLEKQEASREDLRK